MNKRNHPLYLYPETAATIIQLAADLGAANQRGNPSVSAFCEYIGLIAPAAYPEMVAALKIVEGCAGGEDWDDLVQAIMPEEIERESIS